MTFSLSRPLAFAVAVVVFVLDQLSKAWIVRTLGDGMVHQMRVLPWLNFVYAENPGISMSMFLADSNAERWALVGLTGVIAATVVVLMLRTTSSVSRLAYAMIAGGAVGNILDRVRLGHVIDFIQVHAGGWSFFIFNLADSAISVGIAILFLEGLFLEGKRRPHSAG